MDPRDAAPWGFNGTERPGAVYLPPPWLGHSGGIPAFGGSTATRAGR